MLCSRKFVVAKKFMGEGWGGLSRFSVENFCLTLPKNFVGERLIVSPSFRYRKFIGIRWGGITILRRKRFCLTEPKNFVGEPFSTSPFLGIDNFYASEGCATILCQNFVVSQCQTFS